jgi:hypothetical protein
MRKKIGKLKKNLKKYLKNCVIKENLKKIKLGLAIGFCLVFQPRKADGTGKIAFCFAL